MEHSEPVDLPVTLDEENPPDADAAVTHETSQQAPSLEIDHESTSVAGAPFASGVASAPSLPSVDDEDGFVSLALLWCFGDLARYDGTPMTGFL